MSEESYKVSGGLALDRVALGYQLFRSDGESDDSLRKRIESARQWQEIGGVGEVPPNFSAAPRLASEDDYGRTLEDMLEYAHRRADHQDIYALQRAIALIKAQAERIEYLEEYKEGEDLTRPD